MKLFFRHAQSMIVLALIGTLSLAQEHHPMLVKGSKQMADGDFEGAVTSLKSLLEEQPDHAVGWYQLGQAQFKRKHFAEAAEAYQKSEEHGFFAYILRYPLAQSYAMMGDKAKSFETLYSAIEAGFGNVQALESDEAWNSLRNDPEFAKVKLAADKVARPCLYDDAYNALDFWIGDWDVHNQNGYRIATSTVRKELNGCAIIEDWHSIYANSNAKNYTFYDPSKKQWQQSFVSERGALTNMEGKVDGGKVIITGPGTNAAGDPVLLRLTFEGLPETRGARQTIDQSVDQGETWKNTAILNYVRKAENPQATN